MRSVSSSTPRKPTSPSTSKFTPSTSPTKSPIRPVPSISKPSKSPSKSSPKPRLVISKTSAAKPSLSSSSSSSSPPSSSSSKPKSSAVKSYPFLAKWDNGTKTERQQQLVAFITSHKSPSSSHIEDGCGASLFLARLIASLRITFNEGYSTSQLLRGIGVFVKSGEKPFLDDFVKSGSLSTILELLIHPDVSEDDQQDALEFYYVLNLVTSLIHEKHIVSAGTAYKELIFQLRGHSIIVECMQKCNLPNTLSLTTTLLHSLGTDNPSYSSSLQLALASLLPSHSPTSTIATDMYLLSCHAAVQTLILLLTPPSSLKPIPELTNPILSLLAVPNLAMHSEAALLIDVLVLHESLREEGMKQEPILFKFGEIKRFELLLTIYEVVRELVQMTNEIRGGHAMKQHHHVYINNISLVQNGNININMNTSASTYTGYSLQEGGIGRGNSRLGSTSFPHSSSTNPNYSPRGNYSDNEASDLSEPITEYTINSKTEPKAEIKNTHTATNIEREEGTSIIHALDSPEINTTTPTPLSRLMIKRNSNSDLLVQLHHNYSTRLINSQRKSTSDLLSDHGTLISPRPINNHKTSSSDSLISLDSSSSSTRLSTSRRSSSSSELHNTDLFSSKNSLGSRQGKIYIPPLDILQQVPSPPLLSSPTHSNSTPRQPSSPLSTPKKMSSLTLTPPTTSSSNPSSPSTPTSPNSTFSLTTPTSSLIHGSPVVTTTTHEATAMVMQRLAEAWGSLLLFHGAIPALVSALANTRNHVPTLQQLSATLSLLCQLYPEGTVHLVETIGDLAPLLANGYDPYAIAKLREEMKRRETSNQREPINDNDAENTLTIRMWDP